MVGEPGRRAEGSGAGRDAFDRPGRRWRVRLRLRAGVAHSLAFSNVPYIVVFLSVSFFLRKFFSLFLSCSTAAFFGLYNITETITTHAQSFL